MIAAARRLDRPGRESALAAAVGGHHPELRVPAHHAADERDRAAGGRPARPEVPAVLDGLSQLHHFSGLRRQQADLRAALRTLGSEDVLLVAGPRSVEVTVHVRVGRQSSVGDELAVRGDQLEVFDPPPRASAGP